MPSFKTNRYSMLSETCKACPLLVIQADGVHVDCDPPMSECPMDQPDSQLPESICEDGSIAK
jgi:hypothetical protein